MVSNKAVILGTNNAERMRIHSSGNVGIGTTNPTALFQVAASTLAALANGFVGIDTAAPSAPLHVVNRTGSGGTTGALFDGGNGSENSITINGASNINSSLYFSNTSNGTLGEILNSGVGNAMQIIAGPGSSPSGSELYLPAQLDNSRNLQLTTNAAGSSGICLSMKNSATGDVRFLPTCASPDSAAISSFSSSGNFYTAGNGAIAGSVFSVGGSTLMVVAGNVGIGITSPSSRLSIAGNTTGNILIGDSGLSGYGSMSFNGILSTAAYNIAGAAFDPTLYFNRPSGGAIHFLENNVSANMVIASGGNVGIGKTSPAQLLDISISSAGVSGLYNTNPNAGSGAYADIAASNGPNSLHLYQLGTGWTTSGQYVQGTGVLEEGAGSLGLSAEGTNPIIFWIHETEKMRISAGGNVGIGTANPTDLLMVGTTALAGQTISTVTSCGNIVTFVGTGNVGVITTGSSAVATCSLTWTPAYPTGSVCYAADDSRTSLTGPSWAFGVSSATMTFSGSWTAGDKIGFICHGY